MIIPIVSIDWRMHCTENCSLGRLESDRRMTRALPSQSQAFSLPVQTRYGYVMLIAHPPKSQLELRMLCLEIAAAVCRSRNSITATWSWLVLI